MPIKVVQELFRADRAQLFRNKTFDLNLIQLNRKSHLAAEDDQLASHIHARQIVARVGLSKALPVCLSHNLGKGICPIKGVKNIRESTGKHTFDLKDLVAGFE